jgi:hypothetical protein
MLLIPGAVKVMISKSVKLRSSSPPSYNFANQKQVKPFTTEYLLQQSQNHGLSFLFPTKEHPSH